MALVDSFGRIATDLRVSVTDRCDLRCLYCMPEEGLTWTPSDEILSFAEIERLLRVMQTLGVTTIRLTGGEPLMRRDLPNLIARIKQLGVEDISMTTNGTMLARHADALKRAGLRRVNVSLDSLDHDRFTMITRRDRLERVLEGLNAASSVGLSPVKINCVIVRGVNDDEVVAFAELARVTGFDVRFIEYLPLDADQQWTAAGVVPSAELITRIDATYELEAEVALEAAPSRNFRFADGAPGSVGFIASVTEPFCESCNRIRLTADGQFRSCLFSVKELDLRAMIRGGAEDAEMASAIVASVANKQAGHGIGTPVFVRPARSMSAIGG